MNELLTGERVYLIKLDGKENPNFQKILEAWLDALEFHEMKSRDYSERDEPGVWNLGLRGEWPGVTRKIQKLHKIIWKGKDVLFEGGQEIMMDLMGALGLLLHEQKKISDKYSATWRDNHSNKPTFGPGPADGITVHGKSILDSLVVFPAHKHVFDGNPRCQVCTLPATALTLQEFREICQISPTDADGVWKHSMECPDPEAHGRLIRGFSG
jgi:hypothetical protein